MKFKNIPPLYFFIGILIIIFIYVFLPYFPKIAYPYNWIGIVFICLGAYLNISADKIMKKYNTSHKFEKSVYVVQEGVFQISRNPMYLGMTFILAGLALISKNIAALISPFIFFLVMSLIFIPSEERKMTRELGEEYLKYKQKVRCWI